MDTLKEITYAIHRVTGVNVIKNDSRKSEIVDAKRVYSLLASRRTNESLRTIGDYIGKNHDLIIYHKNKGLDYLETDKSFKKLYKRCVNKIESFKDKSYIKNKISQLETETIKYKKFLQKI
jgi:chromosomal replication initiation ATPase DnaA